MKIGKVAVVGAGNMGSGIAQKIATESIPVTLIDKSRELAEAGKQRIDAMLVEGLERGIFTGDQVDGILGCITARADVSAAANADLVIEAAFEDLDVKRDLFKALAQATLPTAILATNTSSFSVAEIAAAIPEPERVLGLHFFYHPAKNHLVEVIPHAGSDPHVVTAAWRFMETLGKTPIAAPDTPGFIVNRFFVPWLNEAVRLHEEGLSIASIEAAARDTFGVGMGPFELMNVTGVPITLHAARSLAGVLGDFYAPAAAIARQVDSGQPWEIAGDPDPGAAQQVAERLQGVVFHVVAELLSEGSASADDIDIGARVGLRWPTGPVEKMNALGLDVAAQLCARVEQRYGLERPSALGAHLAAGKPFELRRVKLEVRDRVAYVTINRPDQLNALDPATIEQLDATFSAACDDPSVRAIVIAGAGKAFVAGADVKFFVDRMRRGDVDAIVAFASAGQKLFARIAGCDKRVICQLTGMALGGGAELALACHTIVATPRATMAFPETGIGIYPGLGGTQRLTRRLGKGLARYLLYTGSTLRAPELRQLGLAWQVVEASEIDAAVREAIELEPVQTRVDPKTLPADLREMGGFLGAVPVEGLADGSLTLPGGARTLEVARKVRSKALNALVRVSELTDLAESAPPEDGLAAETAGLQAIFSHPNALEGMSALLEGRRPKFSRR